MRSNSHAVWSLVGATAYLGATANAAGVLDIGLVFPRANETYEPSADFPIVWVFQNASLAKHLDPFFQYRVANMSTKPVDIIVYDRFDRTLSDFSNNESEPYFYWTHVNLDGEGPVRLSWEGHWAECKKISPQPLIDTTEFRFSANRSSSFLVDFEIKRGGQKADLVAATANDEECPDEGFAISVTDKTGKAPLAYAPYKEPRTCVVVDSSSPTPTANPCRVKVDKATVEFMEAELFKSKCSSPLGKPANCPKKDHAFQQLAIAGTATTFAAALGVLSFLLV